MPLEPPCTSNVSPGCKRPNTKTLLHTVNIASGSAAAWIMSSEPGIGNTWPASTRQYSAYPPPASNAHTESPTLNSVTPSPSAAIVPDTSSPGYDGTPAGDG